MKNYTTKRFIHVLMIFSFAGSAHSQADCNAVSAGPDQTICAGAAIQLQGDAPGINSVISNYWTGGNGTFSPNNTVPNPVYYPTAAEIAAGEVNLVFHLTYSETPTITSSSLLAYDHTSEDSIFYINATDGSVQGVQSNSGNDLTAIGYQTSTHLLYGISNIVEPSNLYEIDVMTNSVNLLISYLGYYYWAGDFDNTHDLFYIIGTSYGAGQQQGLFVFDFSSGAPMGTYLGPLNLFGDNSILFYIGGDGINGLAYDPNESKLYGVSFSGHLYDINTTNGNATLIGDCPAGLRGLAFDYATNTLWGCNAFAKLYELDQNTGALLNTVDCQGNFGYVTSLTYAPGLLPGEQVTCTDPIHIDIIDCNANCHSDIVVAGDSCVQTNLVFEVTSDSTVVDVFWNFGDPSSGAYNTSGALNATHTFSAAGNYVVTAIVTTSCGTDTLTETLAILPCENPDTVQCDLEVPNVFSPNADGVNDYFSLKCNCPADPFSCVIMNRWGNVVYTSTDPADSWDGNCNGNHCTDGVYFYVITYQFPGKDAETVQGMVTLCRE